MKASNAEKLILIMLADLHKKLGVEGEIDGDFVQDAIYSGNLWGIDWKYSGLFGERDGETPPVVREVCDFLDMWGFLESSWDKLSAADKEQIKKDAAFSRDDVKFIGFDGNHEGEYANVASFLTEKLDRYQSFKGRADLNSHSHTLEIHRRMYDAFREIHPTLARGPMTASQIIEVLTARIHPSQR